MMNYISLDHCGEHTSKASDFQIDEFQFGEQGNALVHDICYVFNLVKTVAIEKRFTREMA